MPAGCRRGSGGACRRCDRAPRSPARCPRRGARAGAPPSRSTSLIASWASASTTPRRSQIDCSRWLSASGSRSRNASSVHAIAPGRYSIASRANACCSIPRSKLALWATKTASPSRASSSARDLGERRRRRDVLVGDPVHRRRLGGDRPRRPNEQSCSATPLAHRDRAGSGRARRSRPRRRSVPVVSQSKTA